MRYELANRNLSPWLQVVDDLFDHRAEDFNPAVDVEESDGHYLMSFDLPGISKDDVKIEVVDKTLTVSGERKVENKTDKNNRHISERYYGSFQRSFTLPSAIDGAKVEASYKDGVLQIVLPKAESTKPRQIKISDGKGGLFSKLVGEKHEQNEREVKASNH